MIKSGQRDLNSSVRKVKSNIRSSEVDEILLDTFKKWVDFALGVGGIGGRVLQNPSGRLASALVAEKDDDGNVVALYLDPQAEGSREAEWLERGHGPIDLKSIMLARSSRISKEGYRYRYIHIKENPISPTGAIGNLKTALFTRQGVGRHQWRVTKKLAQFWTESYHSLEHAGGGKFRTMSDAPGTADWIIPAMAAMSPVKLLRDQLDSRLNKKRAIETYFRE